VPVAYVATGRNVPDALAGVPIAGMGPASGPILLVTESTIPPATATALSNLEPGAITILGGPSAVGPGVAAALDAYTTGPVTRLDGADRYATAGKISEAAPFALAGTSFVATGRNYPDSLAGGAPAATVGGPLLLVPGSSVPAITQAELQRIGPARIYVLGGPSAVAEGVVTAIRGFFP
jgi:putative cell wall-binding protein